MHYLQENQMRIFATSKKNQGLNEEELKASSIEYNDCNDKVHSYIKIENEEIELAKYEIYGCSIANAACAFISENITNLTPNDAKKFLDDFENALHLEVFPKDFGVFQILSTHKSRKKCALIAIRAFRNQLIK